MDIIEIIRSSIKSVFSSKLRTFLTMLGIVIGIGSVITINGLGNGSNSQVEEQLNSEMKPTQITLNLRSSNSKNVKLREADALTLDDYEYLKEEFQGYYDAIAPTYTKTAYVTYLNSTEFNYLDVKGVVEDSVTLDNLDILYGRYITDEEVEEYSKVVVISDTLANKYYGYLDEGLIGEEFVIRTWEGKQKFTLIGIYKNKQAELITYYGDEDIFPESVYIPIKTAQRLFNIKTIDSIILNVIDKERVLELTGMVDAAIHKYRETTGKYQATNLLYIAKAISSAQNTLKMLLMGIASISLFVAGVGIMNIMLVTVTERTREIGIRKSIGAKNIDILIQFMIEAVIITIIGGILGIIVGWGTGILAGKLLNIRCIISINTVITSITISTGIGLLFGVYPARKASLLNPIEALTKL